jgi:cytochrome b pre-mRNA-processing protein 3
MGMSIGRLFRHLRQRSHLRDAAHHLYMVAVRQARQPTLYSAGGVSDTLDGRFDLIVLHVVLLVRRLRACGEAGRPLSQALFDVMFDDMDQSLREMGVGDLRVGKRVKQMARAFYGRAEAYDRAFDLPPGERRRTAIAEALARNIYNGGTPPEDRLRGMALYVEAIITELDEQDQAALLGGDVRYPPVPPSLGEEPAPEVEAKIGR